MAPGKIHNNPIMLERRRFLRNNSTSAEICLWTMLNSRQLYGRKFRRQHGIGRYIVDFYCPSEKLIIELDGEVHNHPDQIIYDRKRDDFLKELGFNILRIENELVFCNMQDVLTLISSRFVKPRPLGVD